MTTVIEDNQLLTELEELYLLSKHWISDLDFLEQDLDFFKKLFGINVAMLVKGNEFQTITNTLISIAKSNKEQEDLKAEIHTYLHKLEQLIVNDDHAFELELLETYNRLEARLENALNGLKAIKENVFALSRGGGPSLKQN